MRITGLATGLDMDEIIKDSMRPYRIKIQQQQQNKEVVEIKQKLYRDIISDASKFYDKYFDLTKSDSLLNSSSYKSVVFSSSSSAVTVTGSSEAKVGNYTITGTTTATAAKAVVVAEDIKDNKITINGKEYVLTGENEKEKANNLNSELKKAGINVSVRYSEMAGTTEGGNKKGFIFESTVLGEDATFTIGGGSTPIGTINLGKDATKATLSSFNISDLKSSGKIKIGGTEIDLEITDTYTEDDVLSKLNSKLSSYNFKAEKDDDGNIKITSTVAGKAIEDPEIEVGDIALNFNQGTDATKSTVTLLPSDLNGQVIIGGNVINLDMSQAEIGKEDEYLNEIFKENNINVSASLDGNNIVLTSNSTGVSSEFNVAISSTGTVAITGGNDANITIKDDKGGVYTHTGNSNSLTLDGVTFTFNGSIDGEVKITGKNDVTEVKDKLVNFINDYNTLIEKLNTLTSTKHDRSYVPLTDEQKKEMSETEIKLWDEKVEKGQLYKDSNLTRITSSLKSTMRTFMSESGLNLEEIGIVPVQDYSGSKNGTFTINEEKLTKALEDNMDDVMNLFINPAPNKEELIGKTEEEKIKLKSQTGILYQLKDTLYSEFKTSTSALYEKAGMEGTSTFANNELTKIISNYEKKIQDMEKDFSKREQALYSKYATLETMMNKLNAQQSNLLSQLGMS